MAARDAYGAYDDRDARFLAVDDEFSARPLSRRSRQASRSPDGRRQSLFREYHSDIESEWDDPDYYSGDLHDNQEYRIKRPSRKRIPSPGRVAAPPPNEVQHRTNVSRSSINKRTSSPHRMDPVPPSHRRAASYTTDAKVPRYPTAAYSSTPSSDGQNPKSRAKRPSLSGNQTHYSYPTSNDKTSVPKDQRSDPSWSRKTPTQMPGGFPFAPDTLQPEDSRSEPSPSRPDGSSWSLWSRRIPFVSLSGSTARPSTTPSSSSSALGLKSYQYSPLRDMEFRLVKVLPARMSTIKCEILHASLDSPPDYVAISYAWGDPDETRKVVLEGVSIPVGANMHEALAAIREKNIPVLVWVDALCIDQQNKDERTQQVQHMTYIYKKATSVAIWLGPESDDSKLALKLLEDVADYSESQERSRSLIAAHVGGPDFPAVVSLFERDYWKRLWVVQEIFNAKDIVVYCGSSKLPWSVYRSASDVFWRHKSDLYYYFPGSDSNDRNQRVSQTHLTDSQVLVYQGPSSIPDVASLTGFGEESLLEVMRACRRKLSSDPRDKVFGVLGVLPEEIRNEFPIDYNLSMKEVYINVVDYLLSTTERFEVICESIHFPLHNNSTSLPTWVPDWSHIPEVTALGRSFEFSAAGTSKSDCRLLDERRKLEVSAIYLDEVSIHGISVGTLTTLADYLMAFIHWRALLLGSVEAEVNGDSFSLEEAFCRTLSLGQSPRGWEDPHIWLTACYHVFSSLIRERLPHLPLDHDLMRFINVRTVDIQANARRSFLQEHFGAHMMGRCFYMTEHGLLGMGSGFMASGDIVVVPLGCSTPILLRQEGRRNEYRFVGDVYVHGYMHGRAMDEWKKGKRELRKYVLH